MVQLNNIVKYFNKGTVDQTLLFDNFSFHVKKGDFVSVIGSNGSGKTTLLNLICGSISADGGEILLKGKNITHAKEHKRAETIGRVFQDPKSGTCSELTILENMALADNKGKIFGLSTAVSKKRINYYIKLLKQCEMGLENRLHVKVGNLSGGQRQALALVIANMTDIELLILDEHTAALDPKTSETIMRLTKKLVEEKGVTTIMVTHNLRFAVDYGNRIVMMHEGKCVIDASGEEKQKLEVSDLLSVFNQISIECGN